MDGSQKNYPASFEEKYVKKRREKRFRVPEIYREYIEMKISDANTRVPVELLDFSRHGLKLKSSTPFSAGSLNGCAVSIPRSLTKDVLFSVRIKYCFREEDAFMIGAEIEEIADKVWFDIFQEVHNFIVERAGEVF